MTELDEITDGKNLQQLEQELQYQIAQGESMGGEICGHIQYQIELKKAKFKKEAYNWWGSLSMNEQKLYLKVLHFSQQWEWLTH